MIDYEEEFIEYQKAFMEVVSKIRAQNMMTFPVLTYSLLFQNGKFVDEPFARWCSDHNMKWNDSNFFMGADVTSLSSCCRLINDFSKMDAFINSIGGTSLKIGSVKVNTINLMRIAYESGGDIEKYISILRERVVLDMKTLDIIRSIIRRNTEKGLLPNYSYGLIDLSTQYCTIGINAMFEAVRHFGFIKTDEFGKSSYTEEGLAFASRIMDVINEEKEKFKKENGLSYNFNVEAVPAERAAVVLCQKDELLYENKYNDFIYSNQWIPLTQECSIEEKLRLGALLDPKCGGGQISHINIDTCFTDSEVAWEVLNKIAQSGVIYFAFNTRISACAHNHGFYGDRCPTCGGPVVDYYQRIVGFLVPWSNYSKQRNKEVQGRKSYDLDSFKELG